MDCEKYRKLISLALDGELPSGESRELEEHLADCPDCREFKADLQEIHGLSLQRAPVAMPHELAERILEETSGAQVQPRVVHRSNSGYYRIPKIAVWAAAAVIVGLMFSTLFQPFRPATQVQQPSALAAGDEIPQKVIMSEQDIVSQYTINNATVKLPKGG